MGMDIASAAHRPLIGFTLWQASLKWRLAVDRRLAPLGLSHAQYAVLASLRGISNGKTLPSQKHLADHIGLEPMYISKIVRVLEQRGLLERREHPVDPRAVALSLTDLGNELFFRARTEMELLNDRLMQVFGDSDSPRR